METPTPNPAERFAILKEELRLRVKARGARHGFAGVVDAMIGALFMVVIGLFMRLAQRVAERQACRDGAGAEPGPDGGFAATGGDGGADRRADAGAPVARGRAVVWAAVATAEWGAERNACIGDDGTVRAPLPVAAAKVVDVRPEPVLVRPLGPTRGPSTTAERHSLCHLAYGFRIFEVRFAKMGLKGWVESCPIRSGLATLVNCCRFQRLPPYDWRSFDQMKCDGASKLEQGESQAVIQEAEA